MRAAPRCDDRSARLLGCCAPSRSLARSCPVAACWAPASRNSLLIIQFGPLALADWVSLSLFLFYAASSGSDRDDRRRLVVVRKLGLFSCAIAFVLLNCKRLLLLLSSAPSVPCPVPHLNLRDRHRGNEGLCGMLFGGTPEGDRARARSTAMECAFRAEVFAIAVLGNIQIRSRGTRGSRDRTGTGGS